MVVGFTTTYAISAYHHWCCEFASRSGRSDKVCQWLATGWWFSPGPLVSSTNKTDRHDITEILLKVVLNTIKQTNKQTNKHFDSPTHTLSYNSIPGTCKLFHHTQNTDNVPIFGPYLARVLNRIHESHLAFYTFDIFSNRMHDCGNVKQYHFA